VKKLKLNFGLIALTFANYCLGAPFEIKVHDELISDYRKSAFEVETNFFRAPASQNLKTDVLQTRLEYGYGIAKNSEIGANLYLSHYNGDSYVNGGKLSFMYIPTHNEEGLWHYGIKNEVNYYSEIGGNINTFYEFTPILALQLYDWRFTLNPNIDVKLNKNSTVIFSPAAKVAYSVTHTTNIGMEYYADNLPIKGLYSITQQPNSAYLVVDKKYNNSMFNFGIGKSVNGNSDTWVMKLTISRNFD
jgi:hypothetical protein